MKSTKKRAKPELERSPMDENKFYPNRVGQLSVRILCLIVNAFFLLLREFFIVSVESVYA